MIHVMKKYSLKGDMTQHQISFVDSKQLSDGHLAVATICCGDENSKSWLTMAASVVIDPLQRQEAIDFHANRVATLHESMLQAKAAIPSLLGTSTVVAVPAPAPTTTPTTVTPTASVPAAA
jgi:hypothetical protein